MIHGLAHVCFIVSDLNRSLEFYGGKLGFKTAFEFRRENGERHGIYLKAGARTFIELFQGQPAARADNQSYAHICLEVDDVAQTVAELRATGLEVTEPKLGRDQSWQAWVNDPDGNQIELHGYTPKSWQVPHLG